MKEEPEKVSESLLHSVVNDYSASALTDMSETVLDAATYSLVKSDALVKIPILGILVGLTQGVLVFRERRYASKILNFLAETAKATEDDKQRYSRKLNDDPEECRKAGEILLDIIDKITSNEKAVMVGKVFRAFMREDDLTTSQLIHLCEIIERTYLQDLETLRDGGGLYNDANLESVGIKKPLSRDAVNDLIAEAMKQADDNREKEFSALRHGISPPVAVHPSLSDLGMTPEGIELIRILRAD